MLGVPGWTNGRTGVVAGEYELAKLAPVPLRELEMEQAKVYSTFGSRPRTTARHWLAAATNAESWAGPCFGRFFFGGVGGGGAWSTGGSKGKPPMFIELLYWGRGSLC